MGAPSFGGPLMMRSDNSSCRPACKQSISHSSPAQVPSSGYYCSTPQKKWNAVAVAGACGRYALQHASMPNKTVLSVCKSGKGRHLTRIGPDTAAPASLASKGFGVRPPAHMRARMSACAYGHLHAFLMPTHTSAPIRTQMCTHMSIHVSAQMCAHMSANVSTCAHVCTRMHLYTRLLTHVYTYACTHVYAQAEPNQLRLRTQ